MILSTTKSEAQGRLVTNVYIGEHGVVITVAALPPAHVHVHHGPAATQVMRLWQSKKQGASLWVNEVNRTHLCACAKSRW